MSESSSEVKGSWFVTARTYLHAKGGDELLERVARFVPDDGRHSLFEPLASDWYPEALLQQALAGMRAELADGSSHRFLTVMQECTAIGINRFFRVLLRMSSTEFVLRQVPTMWRQIRRGAGEVSVETTPKATVLHYRAFPYFDDENYRLLTRGSLASLVMTSTGEAAEVHVDHYGSDWLDVVIPKT